MAHSTLRCAQLLPRVSSSAYCSSVKGIPGTLQDSRPVFATTHWSVVAACTYSSESETADAALARLCHDYWPPLYSVVRRRGYSPAGARDLVQGCFVYLLHSNAYAHTNRRKGKFRAFLLVPLTHYIAGVRCA